MKYKVLGLCLSLLLFCGALAITALDRDNGDARIHQHLTARQPDAGCSCSGSELCTHLPLVLIDTGGQPIPGEPTDQSYDGETTFTTTATGESMLTGLFL